LTNVNNNTAQFQINRGQVVLVAGATGRMPNIRWALHAALRFAEQRFIYGLGKQAHYLDERVLVVITPQ